MKPIKLTIDGLNSFETEQTLDFSKLSGSVFGIFGKTGSGKSTILDAIALSLYGEVERSKQKIDFINTKCQRAVVSLEFEIFSAGKNRRFLVVRTFSKKKNGIESTAELFELENGEKCMVTEGVTKVDNKIFEIVGLGANEFAKCIALPQGEFSAFLKARPSERTEIMSNIFDLSRYGEKLTASVKNKVNEYDKQVLALSSSLELVKFATDDVLAEAKLQMETAKTEYEKTSEELKLLAEDYAKQNTAYEKQVKLDEVLKTLEKLEKQKQEMEGLKVEVEKNKVANEIKPSYEKLQKDKVDEKELTEKIAGLNEIKLQKQTELHEATTEFEDFKVVYESKIIELNSKLARLDNLLKFENDLKQTEAEKEKVLQKQKETEKTLNEKYEGLNYLLSDASKIEEEIEKIDDFIEANKPDVDLSYALEQTKGIESEIILIDDFVAEIEKLVDKTNYELEIEKQSYNDSIKAERDYIKKAEQIQNSIEVAFEDADTTNFAKLRSCDKQIEDMKEVKTLCSALDSVLTKIDIDTENRQATIIAVNSQIEAEQMAYGKLEKDIEAKERELAILREERESMLGDNVISLISEHLSIGEECPVCENKVVRKIYGDKIDLNSIESQIKEENENLKALRYDRDKAFANVITLKARIEFEKAQIEINKAEIEKIFEDKQMLYKRFIEEDDGIEERFNKLQTLIENTSNSLESLIALQGEVRTAHERVVIGKTEAGTKITTYQKQLEDLLEILYSLQRKKAEREFAILNMQEKYENLKEYKKQIAEGKNIELLIDNKKDEKYKLRERQNEINNERIAKEKEIAETKSALEVLYEKEANCDKQITNLKAEIIASGVPENTSVEEEKQETQKELSKLKFDNENTTIKFESAKDNLKRVENEYDVKFMVLNEKRKEIKELEAEVIEKMLKAEFASGEALEKCFAESYELKVKQSRLDEYEDELRFANLQKEELEKDVVVSLDEKEIAGLKLKIDELDEKVKALSAEVGKTSAEFNRIADANEKNNEISKSLKDFTHKLDLAKELSSVLKGKALAEYVAEEFLNEITNSANQKLGILMDGRYTLKFENKEFFVEDNFNDAKVRPASTLSGGETFLVSLSLALSISNEITMLSEKSMDFFFLDEGFGTLDAELCEAVISALYKLESQNLNIGLISHVGELEESIKNKVLVEKTAGGSKLKIVHSL